MRISLKGISRFLSSGKSFLKLNMDILEREHVRMKDKESVIAKIKWMTADGAQKLQVITDFDHTITKSRTSKGEVGLLTHGVLANRLDRVQREKLDALCEKYAPIEHNSSMTIEEKTKFMIDWWTKSHDLITQFRFHESKLDEFVREEPKLELRQNSMDFIRLSEKAGIPVLIFSGGIGNLISVILRQHLGNLPPNVHTISNFMNFDEKGIICGFRDPIVHIFNKNASVVQNDHSFFDQLKSRSNVLLIGDSLGDLHMDTGIVNETNVLKIGFFNREVSQASLEPYLSGFDIVLVDDQTFDVPLAILKSIVCDPQA